MTDENIINKIKDTLQTKVIEITNPALRRIFVKVNRENLLETAKLLKEQLGFTHLSTITGVDKGENFEVLYHFANEFSVVTVRILTPRTEPKIPSICEVIPGAILYERELPDMFGIIVENIPDSRSLLLPDGWPQGEYPLRKDWKYERPPEIIPGEE
jgi:membrane-bound hydrogenase subunit beta